METPILYYWGPCATCAVTVKFCEENGIALDKRDVEQETPYMELLGLGGDANKIPYMYFYTPQKLVQGNDDIIAYLKENYL